MRAHLALLTALLTALAPSHQASLEAAPVHALAQGAGGEAEEQTEGRTLDEVMEAGARVDLDQSEASLSEIVMSRGDTVTFKAVLRDSEGKPVPGAIMVILPAQGIYGVRPGVVELRRTLQMPDSFLIVAEGPGQTRLQTFLATPAMREGPPESFFSIPVTVNEWPAARVQIDAPGHGAYVWSIFPMVGRVITTHETEHATAVISWSSSDREVASVTPHGVITFRKPGRVEIGAESEGLSASRTLEVRANPVAGVALTPEHSEVRTGDVVRFELQISDRAGRPLTDVHIAYSVSAVEAEDGGAIVYDDGAFVAERPGVYRVLATAGDRSASALVKAAPRDVTRAIKLTGRGALAHVSTSDLWIFEGRDGRDYAYTGTHADGGGERMFVWDVTDPGAPILLDSVVVDARVVNDVKISDDATVAVITREGASDRRGGIVILDISNPAHPTILSQFSEDMTGGVHNTWINGDVVYIVHNGTSSMRIIDISDPLNPKHVGRREVRPGDENKLLHDIWAQDGFAYLSYWDDGLIILDVGAGIKGGTAREPQFVSQYKYPIGNTHTAYRHGNYVFVGDEIFGCAECTNGPRGYIHVIDVTDIESPAEVARFEVPEAGAHNIWVEDDLLYIAYYQGGVRVVDVSGELRGDLYAQGRQISWYHTAAEEGEGIHANAPLAWGPQTFKGYLFVSDMNSGLWVIQLEPPSEPLLP